MGGGVEFVNYEHQKMACDSRAVAGDTVAGGESRGSDRATRTNWAHLTVQIASGKIKDEEPAVEPRRAHPWLRTADKARFGHRGLAINYLLTA